MTLRHREYLGEAILYTTDYDPRLPLNKALSIIKRSGLPLKVSTREVNTSGGMRPSSVVSFKKNKVSDNEYDRFLSLRTDIGGVLLKKSKSKSVDVGGQPEWGSFRILHPLD